MGWVPPPVDRQIDGWTDTCQNITFPRTTYAGGKNCSVNALADVRGGATGMCLRSNFFHFPAVFGENLAKYCNRLAPPPWRLVPPRMGNPGSRCGVPSSKTKKK